MPRVAADLLLLFMTGSVIWWQAGYVRLRLSTQEYDGDRGLLIVLGGFLTLVIGMNVVNLMNGVWISWEQLQNWDDSLLARSRLSLLFAQIGVLGATYALMMVIWKVIRRRALDVENEPDEDAREYGLTANQRLIAGVVLAIIAIPPTVRNAFSFYGSVRGSLALLVFTPLTFFAIDLLFGWALLQFIRFRKRQFDRIAKGKEKGGPEGPPSVD